MGRENPMGKSVKIGVEMFLNFSLSASLLYIVSLLNMVRRFLYLKTCYCITLKLYVHTKGQIMIEAVKP